MFLKSRSLSNQFLLTAIIAVKLLVFSKQEEAHMSDHLISQNGFSSRRAKEDSDSMNNGNSCNQIVLYQPVDLFPMLQQEKRQFEFAGRSWEIRQQWDKIGISAVIWEAAIALVEYLESQTPSLLTEKSVIELGAGTGLVGMVAACLGALSVDITDKNIESAISNLKLNSGNFQTNNVKVLELEWGVTDLSLFHAPYDIILATDVIYIESSFSSLLQTLWELSSNKTLILLSCKRRYDRDDRFFELSKKQFKYEVIMQWTKSDNVTIYRLLKNS